MARTESSSRQVGRVLWAHRARLTLGFCLLLVNRAAMLVLPASTKWLLDEVVARARWDTFPILAGVVGAATLLQALTAFSLSQVIGVSALRAVAKFRSVTQAHVICVPIGYFDAIQSGNLGSRVMADTDSLRSLLGPSLLQFLGSVLTAVMSLSVLLYLNTRLTMLTMLVVILLVAVMVVGSNRLRPLYREGLRLRAEVSGSLVEVFGGARIVKAYRAEKREALAFTKGVHQMFRNAARGITGVSMLTAFSTLAMGTISVLTIVVGGSALRDGTMTVGDLVMYLLFTSLTVNPMVQLASFNADLSHALAGLDRVREIREVRREDDDEARRTPVRTLRGEVDCDDISFEYSPGVPVLKHLSFHAPIGSTTALVGPSGSGKSTLVSLILGFYRPSSGRILVDGHDLATIRLYDFREHIGVVLQENHIFDGTIADNIAYGRPHATRDQIMEAGRLAHCDEFVSSFELGYRTLVGERGVRLSGGQRQRVAIARALLVNPKILVLDEATSNLDSESEALIQEGLSRLRKGRTTFVIAHRLSTIRSADQILVLNAGRIVERGSHEELLARNGCYRRLYDTQYRLHDFLTPGADFSLADA